MGPKHIIRWLQPALAAISSTTAKAKLWVRISLRTLLIVVTMCAVGLGILSRSDYRTQFYPVSDILPDGDADVDRLVELQSLLQSVDADTWKDTGGVAEIHYIPPL